MYQLYKCATLRMVTFVVTSVDALEWKESGIFLPNGCPRYHVKVLLQAHRESITADYYEDQFPSS